MRSSNLNYGLLLNALATPSDNILVTEFASNSIYYSIAILSFFFLLLQPAFAICCCHHYILCGFLPNVLGVIATM
jgi:hypothetical protein